MNPLIKIRTPQEKAQWKHKVSGTIYTVIGYDEDGVVATTWIKLETIFTNALDSFIWFSPEAEFRNAFIPV